MDKPRSTGGPGKRGLSSTQATVLALLITIGVTTVVALVIDLLLLAM